jgi:hypothetical protein
LVDVVTAYLYVSLDSDIYTKTFDGISIPDTHVGHDIFFVKLTRSLYDVKQSRRM